MLAYFTTTATSSPSPSSTCFEICVFSRMVRPGNTNLRGRLCTVDLLIKVACFVKELVVMFSRAKAADLK
jgi:hypothetical protein